MSGNASVTIWDAAGKPTGMHINIPTLTGANYVAVSGNVIALADALVAISLSGQYQALLSQPTATGTPADRGGVRGQKALVRWFSANEGDGGQYGSNEIGTVDAALFTAVGDKLVLQGALYDAIKAAFDAVAETENGNAVAVYEIELVTRTL